MLIVIALGMVVDSSSILLIVLPPMMLLLAEQFGMNLVWFGVVTVVAVEIGLLTPPFGLSVYVIKSTLPGREHLARRHLPRHSALHTDDAGRAAAAHLLPRHQPRAVALTDPLPRSLPHDPALLSTLSIYLENDIIPDPPAFAQDPVFLATRTPSRRSHRSSPGLKKEDPPTARGWEGARATSTHNGTHLDAPLPLPSTRPRTRPWAQKPITIDQVPLEWCFQPGVKLDFRHLPTATWSRRRTSRPNWPASAMPASLLEIVVVNTRAGSRYGTTIL